MNMLAAFLGAGVSGYSIRAAIANGIEGNTREAWLLLGMAVLNAVLAYWNYCLATEIAA